MIVVAESRCVEEGVDTSDGGQVVTTTAVAVVAVVAGAGDQGVVGGGAGGQLLLHPLGQQGLIALLRGLFPYQHFFSVYKYCIFFHNYLLFLSTVVQILKVVFKPSN